MSINSLFEICVDFQKQPPGAFYDKVFLKVSQNSQWEYMCWRPATLLKIETATQVFLCKFWEIFKKTIFYRALSVAASKLSITNYKFFRNDLQYCSFKYFLHCDRMQPCYFITKLQLFSKFMIIVN